MVLSGVILSPIEPFLVGDNLENVSIPDNPGSIPIPADVVEPGVFLKVLIGYLPDSIESHPPLLGALLQGTGVVKEVAVNCLSNPVIHGIGHCDLAANPAAVLTI